MTYPSLSARTHRDGFPAAARAADSVAAAPPVRPGPPPGPRSGPRSGPRLPTAVPLPGGADLEQQQRTGYAERLGQIRSRHESVRRHAEAVPLYRQAQQHDQHADDALTWATFYDQNGEPMLARQWREEADHQRSWAHHFHAQADAVLDGRIVPPQVDVQPDRWREVNTDDGGLTVGPVETGTVSALTGTDHPPGAEQTRPYGQQGGLRPPLALHQRDLERAMPRGDDGTITRTADPRVGDWFGYANDGGPGADPARSINCQDCVISLYETWVHGRPRVSAPRTFDCYADGDIQRPLGGEADGPRRAEALTGARYQTLLPETTEWPAGYAQQAVDQAYGNLHDQLLAGGHGSMAFIIHGTAGGGAHAWAALNQHGTILYVDPQSGFISANAPLYTEVTCVDAMVIGPDARPLPLPYHGPGRWTAHAEPQPDPGPPSLAVDGSAPPPQLSAGGRPERTLSEADRYANRVYLLAGPTPAPGSTGPLEPVPPARMLTDPSRGDLRALGVGSATLADLGLHPESLPPDELRRHAAALRHTALVSPDQIRFTGRSVSPTVGERAPIGALAADLRAYGWRGGPIHGVRWGDGTLCTLDNGRLRAAREAGLAVVPLVVHGPREPLDAWPQDWTPQRRQQHALDVDIVELADGRWAPGPAEGPVVRRKGTLPRTFGDVALFRAAGQRSLLPGHLFGTDREPVVLDRPPPADRQVALSADEQRVLDDLRLHAAANADRVEADLVAVGATVTAELKLARPVELRGAEHASRAPIPWPANTRTKRGQTASMSRASLARSTTCSDSRCVCPRVTATFPRYSRRSPHWSSRDTGWRHRQ